MNCEQFQNEIERAIDERSSSTSVSAHLAGHANSCETCRSAWQDFLLLESALASWTEPVEVDLVERVVTLAKAGGSNPVPSPPRGEGGRRPDEGTVESGIGAPTGNADSSPALRAPSPPREEGTRRRIWLTVTTVAVVVLGVAIAFRTGPDQTANTDLPQPAPEHNAPFTPDLNEDEQYAGVDELISSTRSAWEGIASKAVNRASGLSVFVPDLKSDLGLPVSNEPEPEETPEVEVNGQEPSLIPGKLNRAFDFLLDVSDVTTT